MPASIDMVNVLGPRDEFLRILERELEADLHVRGNEFTLTGSAAAVALAAEVITELVTVLRTGQGLSGDAVERIVSMLAAREEARPADVLTHNILSSRGRTIRPKTLNQKRYVDAIDKHTVVFGDRPGRHRQDLPGRGQGGPGAAEQAGHPDHPDPAGGRGRASGSASCPAP